MKDLILTSISKNYSWNDVKTWISSLLKTDYAGDILFFCYNFDGNEDILKKLKECNIEIVIPNNTYRGQECNRFVFDSGLCTPTNSHMVIHNVRFFHIWQYLHESQKEYNRVINTDVRDIIFQTNPSVWLDKNMKLDIVLGSEMITYKNSPWNTNNFIQSFGPYVFEYLLKDHYVCNAGSFAAKFETEKLICLLNYIVSCNTGINADQAGVNLLIRTLLSSKAQVTEFKDLWALQIGQHEHEISKYAYIKDGKVYGANTNDLFCLVHQYDRIPNWKMEIEKYYE